jgi:hypothetical protein
VINYHHYTVRQVPDVDWKVVVSTDPWSAAEEFAEAITDDADKGAGLSVIFGEGIQVEVKDLKDNLFRYKVTAEAAISYFAEESEEATQQVTLQVTPQVTQQVAPEAPRWIPVEEAMPPDDPRDQQSSVRVMVATRYGSVFCAWWSKDSMEWHDYDGTVRQVTHWMPLPPTPNGGA